MNTKVLNLGLTKAWKRVLFLSQEEFNSLVETTRLASRDILVATVIQAVLANWEFSDLILELNTKLEDLGARRLGSASAEFVKYLFDGLRGEDSHQDGFYQAVGHRYRDLLLEVFSVARDRDRVIDGLLPEILEWIKGASECELHLELFRNGPKRLATVVEELEELRAFLVAPVESHSEQ